MARSDPRKGEKRKRVGLRGVHLRKAYATNAAWRATGKAAVNRAAAVVTAWSAVARGGEVAPGREGGPMRSDLAWVPASPGVEAHAVLMLCLDLNTN